MPFIVGVDRRRRDAPSLLGSVSLCLLTRQHKIEGQARDAAALEEDCYFRNEVRQTNAIIAAVREEALLIMARHLEAGIEFAVGSKDTPAAL